MVNDETRLFEADIPCYPVDDIAKVEIIGQKAIVVFFEYQVVRGVVVRMPVVSLKRLMADIPPESLARWSSRGIVTRFEVRPVGRPTPALM